MDRSTDLMTTPPALHSAKTPKWGSPEFIIAAARELFGGVIHTDPASSELFNLFVKAEAIYTEQSNGLLTESEWWGNIFLNPPGGLVREFWQKLMAEIKAGRVVKAFWVGFSVEQLCLLADEEYHPLDFSSCILRKRLAFLTEDGKPGTSPSHGCYICAIGCEPSDFDKIFKSLGKVKHG